MELKHKHLQQMESGRRRGWLIYLLYVAKPHPIDFNTLIKLMDQRNFPMSCRKFSEKIDFLCSVGLVRVFPMGAVHELTKVDQAKLIQAYCDNDGDDGDGLCASLTSKGVLFQEGLSEEVGVSRVN